MKTTMLFAAACLVFLLAFGSTTNASAQGIHFGGGGVHVDIGNPHQYYGNYGSYYGGYGSHCGYGGYNVSPYTTFYGGGWGGQARWHDTTHYDYHPGEFVRHRNHLHYFPGHYDLHEDGHWD